MSKDKKKNFQTQQQNPKHAESDQSIEKDIEINDLQDVDDDTEVVESQEDNRIVKLTEELESWKEQAEKEKKEYLFLMAEFDNFRKRTLREKSEIIKNAGEQVLKGILPIVDDFERGIQAAEKTDDISSVKEGMVLIYNKLKKFLEQNGVREIDPDDRVFDTEKHEAVSVVSVPDDNMKGKILDTVEKGYTINDKVLRHAKVVVGQ